MRASRALFASLGASLSLVLAGSLALATISTVVAFQGWPGVASGKRAAAEPELIVAAADRSAVTSQAVALPAPRRHAAQPRRRPTRAAAPATPPTHRRIATRATGTATTQAHPAAAPAAMAISSGTGTSSRKTPKRIEMPTAEPVRKIGNDLGGAVAGAGKGLGDAVANVNPELGRVVKDLTGGLGSAVAATTKLVADTVDALTGAKKK